MMISITSTTVDASGALIIDAIPSGTKANNRTARISRSKTLDGGVVIENFGFAEGDRTISIQARITEWQKTIIEYLRSYYPSNILVSFDGGVYKAHLETVNITNDLLDIILFIESKEV